MKGVMIVETISPPIFDAYGNRAFFIHWHDKNFHDGVHLIRGQIFCRYPVDCHQGKALFIDGPHQREKAFREAGWPKPPCDGYHKEWLCPAIIKHQEKANARNQR